MRRMVVVLVLTGALLAIPISPALAFHCYVENKPKGAGTKVTLDETGEPVGVFEAGQSGKLVVQGAFLDLSVFGVEEDVFIRGQSVDVGVQGVGSLPEPPHVNGGENGVQALEFEE